MPMVRIVPDDFPNPIPDMRHVVEHEPLHLAPDDVELHDEPILVAELKRPSLLCHPSTNNYRRGLLNICGLATNERLPGGRSTLMFGPKREAANSGSNPDRDVEPRLAR